MQNVPKIVRERLRAAAPAVNHPDADLLTAFAERSLPDGERTAVLEHLARCGDCRDIVALALPEQDAEPVGTVVRPSLRRWLTWPALRWGFVAAGVVAIASVGVLQLQRARSQSATTASSLKQSAPLEVAANEPRKSVAPFVAPASADKDEKLQSPTPALTDSVDVANAPVAGKETLTRAEAPPVRVVPPQAGAGIGGGASRGAVLGGPSPYRPGVANQWQNTAQNQAPAPTPPSGLSKQHADAQVSANGRIPAASQQVEVSSASPMIATEDASSGARQIQNQPAASPVESFAYSMSKAKPPVPPAAPGQIAGYVVDPTGAVVANARITITPSKKGGPATAVTNSQGAWLIAGLPTGAYKAQAEAPGFKTTVLDFNYDAHQPSSYLFTLSPGSVSEMVEVSSAQAEVRTQAASTGSTIVNPEVNELPINGRNLGVVLGSRLAGPPARWAINAAGALQRSLDQGSTWQTVDVNANPAPSAMNLEVLAQTSRAKVKKDENKTLKREAATLTFRAVSAMGSEVWAGGSAGVLYHSADAGNHWTRIVPASAGTMLTGDIISLEFADAQHGKLSTSTSEVWTTSDAGQTWQKQ